MRTEAISLIVTVALAFLGYLVTYLNNLRLTKRKERLELINKRINEFYGPLYIASKAGKIAYKALLLKLGKNEVFGVLGKDPPPDEKDLAEWRVWLKNVFMPLNEYREQLILESAHLIREEEMPHCLLEFVTHVSAYKAIVKKWEAGDLSEYAPLIDFPTDIDEYASKSYKDLKKKQLALIGE